jgi:hypothetical protein
MFWDRNGYSHKGYADSQAFEAIFF